MIHEMMEKEFEFPGTEPFFEGHFPGRPVTPGVMLMDRAVASARELLGREAVLEGAFKVKFSRPVLPDETVLLRLERRNGADFAYSFLGNGTVCASGVLRFRP